MSTTTYWPAGGKLLARITQDGKLVCIFKSPPTDEIGHAMAAALDAPEPKVCECPPGVRNITDGGHFPACTACHRRIK